MGTWSHKPFGNDAAKDWLWTLEKSKGDALLLKQLKKGVGTARNPPDEDDCATAIAAAAVIAAAAQDPVGNLPREARQWVLAQGFSPHKKLLDQASRLVRQVARNSALRALWQEAGSLGKWSAEMNRLADTLENPPKVRSVRKPKAPGGRLGLAKLIKSIDPALNGPTRAALTRKLASLTAVNALVPGEWQKTPLHLLAAQGLLPEVVALVERGATIDPPTPQDASAATPFELACGHGHAEVARYLLIHGPRIERQVTLLHGRVFSYPSALFSAVLSGDEATVILLREHGLDLQFIEMNRRSLLHYAAESGRASMVRFLVAQGLKLDQGDDSGWTPLHLAVRGNQSDNVSALLDLGANPNARDNEGASPVDFATENSHREVARILRKHGGVCCYQKPKGK
jgi:hypothetical protein